jgi:hypothetical protein
MYGDLDSSECLSGSYRITDEQQCQAAATAAGITWGGSVAYSELTTGCLWNIPGAHVLLNTDKTNAHRIYDRLLCAVGTGTPSSNTCRSRPARRARRCSDFVGCSVMIGALALLNAISSCR